jgi:tetratricopeptide (TPR) repeat protein
MKKIILLILIMPPILVAAFLYNRYEKNREQLFPFPYFITGKMETKPITAPILIIGNQQAKNLYRFKETLAQAISQELVKPIEVAHLADDNWGAHRILHAIKALPATPKVVILMGNSSESYEKKFETKDIATIQKNIQIFQDLRFQNLIMLSPLISRFFYFPMNYVELKQNIIQEDITAYNELEFQKRGEVTFKIYQQEMHELLSYLKVKRSNVILVSTPINYKKPPTSSCSHPQQEFIKELTKNISILVKEGDLKSALLAAKELTELAPGHAHSYYQYGLILEKLGQREKAFSNYRKAIAFNCDNKITSPVFNSILKKVSQNYNLHFYDFDLQLINAVKDNIAFKDDQLAQDMYMESLATNLGKKIKTLLQL